MGERKRVRERVETGAEERVYVESDVRGNRDEGEGDVGGRGCDANGWRVRGEFFGR